MHSPPLLRILANGSVMQQTTLQLVDVSHTTQEAGQHSGDAGTGHPATCLWRLTLSTLLMCAHHLHP